MHRLHIPAPPLASFVRCFWYWEGMPHPHARERLMPNGEATIVFNLRDDEMRLYDADDLDRYTSCGLAGLTGPRTGCFAIDTAAQDRVIGIEFQPGGTFPFFREPAGEIANQSAPLDCLWGAAVGEIREQLLAARSVDAMFVILATALLERLVRPLELHPAVGWARGWICRAPHVATVAGVVDRIGLSQRRFIELFRDQVGLPPKAFCRVRRFQRVLESVHRKAGVDWAQVALDGGYYDQAHFIHDFQGFAGMTPAAYLARATEHLNHVPMG
ncbi:MAG TPA: helix-turn-helix domain-containing protein [Acidobacteriaceae bacterium]|nr:helix-turn-helix domain-containing protein [Acidobacteriaceae bacterium]